MVKRFCPGTTIWRAVILLSVSVPVLSEQIAETDPSVSTDGSRLTIAFCDASTRVPVEYSVVTTAGSPVGIAEMASATPAMKSSSKSWSCASPSRIMATNAMPARPAMIMVSRSSCFCSGVLSDSVRLSSSAMLPISVSIPVPVTISSPRPRVTDVFMNTTLSRSPSGTSSRSIVATSLSTGVLSPVSAASSISSVAATNSRPSAGTRFPASMSTTSPGTSSAASISRTVPSRRTRAMSFSIFSSAARLASAFDS